MAVPFVAQRLWLLERPATGSPPADAAPMEFAGAVAVLERHSVRVVIIISNDASRASEQVVRDRDNWARLDRNAFKFATLDQALEGIGRIREQFIIRGWRDAEYERLDAASRPRKERS